MIYKSTLTNNFWLDQISHVILSCYILGVEGVHYGNVPVENNANRFLFCNVNWPISFMMVELAIQPQLKNTHSAAQ